jgi:formimidoylglutamate deiminase
MADLFFDSAFLSGSWEENVRISVDQHGWITSVRSDGTPRGAQHIPGIALPGVPNVHSHAFQRAMAGLTERGSPGGDSFWLWRDRMYHFLRSLDPNDVEVIASQLYSELLRHGFTSVAEFHYLRNDVDGRAYEDPVEMGRRILGAGERTGLGVTLLPVLYCAADFGGSPPEHEQRRFVSTVEELVGDVVVLGAAADGVNARVGLALHSLRAVPPAELAVAVEAVRGIDETAPIHLHVAEQLREVEASIEWSGARPVEWLMGNAPVDERWCLVHATHVDDGEVQRMAESGCVVALCPTTEANLGDGVFPLAAYVRAGGSWAVGTDSHVGRSPASELRMLEYGQRLTERTRNVAAGSQARSTGRALLDAAWAGGAQACGRAIGRLEPGYRADIVVLDTDHPSLVGREGDDVLDSWVFSEDDTPVRDVFVGGRAVVRDGRHVVQQEIWTSYAELVSRLGAETPQLTIYFED